MNIRISTFATALAIVLGSAQSAAATAVTSCGQTVSGQAELSAGLDCTGFPGPAVTLRPKGKLDLRGFTLRGGLSAAVRCEGDCRIESSAPGGTITEADGRGVDAGGPDLLGNTIRADVRLSGVTVSFSRFEGVVAAGTIRLSNSSIVDNGGTGVHADAGGGAKLKFQNSTVARNGGAGVQSDNGRGAVFIDCSITDNGDIGVIARRPKFKRATVTGNAANGISASGGIVRISSSTIAGNSGNGVALGGAGGDGCTMRVSASTVTGNTYDLASCERPRVKRTTCDTSVRVGVPPPADDWDVCSLD